MWTALERWTLLSTHSWCAVLRRIEQQCPRLLSDHFLCCIDVIYFWNMNVFMCYLPLIFSVHKACVCKFHTQQVMELGLLWAQGNTSAQREKPWGTLPKICPATVPSLRPWVRAAAAAADSAVTPGHMAPPPHFLPSQLGNPLLESLVGARTVSLTRSWHFPFCNKTIFNCTMHHSL